MTCLHDCCRSEHNPDGWHRDGPPCGFTLLPRYRRAEIHADVEEDLRDGRARARILEARLAASALPDKRRRPF